MMYANGKITKRFAITGTSGDGSPVLSEQAVVIPIPCNFMAPRASLLPTLAAKGITSAETLLVESPRLTLGGVAAPQNDDRLVAQREGGALAVYVVVAVEPESFGDTPGAANTTTLAVVLDADQSEAQP